MSGGHEENVAGSCVSTFRKGRHEGAELRVIRKAIFDVMGVLRMVSTCASGRSSGSGSAELGEVFDQFFPVVLLDAVNGRMK